MCSLQSSPATSTTVIIYIDGLIQQGVVLQFYNHIFMQLNGTMILVLLPTLARTHFYRW